MGLGLDFADAFVLLAFLALAGFTYLKATNPKAGPTVFAKQIIVQERDINGYLARGVAGSDGTKVDEKAEESPSSSPAESPSASSVSSDDTTKHKDNDKLKETPEEAFARPITPVTDFDWKSVQRRKFRPFKPIYHITMGECSKFRGRRKGSENRWSGMVARPSRHVSAHGSSPNSGADRTQATSCRSPTDAQHSATRPPGTS